MRQCANCGFENLAVARFCANCGRPLGEAQAAGQILTAETRKTITAVFFDLVGSTGLTERLDPEEARAVVGRFYAAVQGVVERFEGTVANLLGDGVLAVFGLPTTHEDDPERAVHAGLAMKDLMASLNAELAGTYGVQLNVRVGLSTGEVVAASGSTFDRDFLISDAVTTAARIQQTAMPGSVVVGERTYRLTSGTIAYRELPAMDVKGKTAPLRVWEAAAPLPEGQGARRADAPFIGREEDLALLHHAFGRTRAEALVHHVTLLGDPGVGKSRLLREFIRQLQDANTTPRVLRGRSLAFGGQIGYHALLEILRQASGLLDTDPSDVVRHKLTQWLRDALPEQDDLLEGLMLTFGGTNGTDADPGRMREALFEAWRKLLTGLAAGRPVVAVFEDIHWADEGLLDLIQSMTGTIEDATLLIVCLGRPELLERRPGWGTGVRNALALDLQPLRVDEAARLVESLGGEHLTPETLQRISDRAEGNPLFAEELVRMLVEGQAGGAAGGAVIPDTVGAVITARIDRLPADERRALQAAAVIGRAFWPSAVAQLAGMSGDDAARAIDAMTQKDLVFAHRQSAVADEREFAFRHILTRDVAYGMLLRTQRQRAHAETARWLETRLGERTEESVEILAEHLRVAGDDARAAGYLRRAANKARRLYANADAIRLFDQALEASKRANLVLDLPHLYLGRGEVHELRGIYAAALADFEAGLVAARQAGNTAVEAVLENRTARIHHREVRLDDAESHFRRSADLAREAGDRLTLGLSLVDLATVSFDRGNMTAAEQTLGEGAAMLRQERDHSGLARALNLRCMVHLAMGYGAEALAAAEEALAAARESGDRSREATSLSYLAVVHGWTGRPRVALEYDRAALDIAEAIGDRRRATYAREFMAIVYSDIGEWGEGIRLTEEFLPVASEVTRLELPYIYLSLGEMYAEVGAAARASDAFRKSASFETRSPGWEPIVWGSAAYAARLAGDMVALNRALDGLLTLGGFVPNDALVVMPVGEGLLEAGRVDDARTLVATRRDIVERFNAPGSVAGLAIIEARLAARDGDLEAARAFLDEAIRTSRAAENARTLRRGLELRVELFNRDDDRQALRDLLARIAASLPDDLRLIFLASPRVAQV